MKRLIASAILFTALVTSAVFAKDMDHSQHEMTSEIVQKTCPVMGGAIDSTLFVEHEGENIYFCCAGCKPMFEKEPAKYMKKIHEEMDAESGAEKSSEHDHTNH